MKNKLKDKAFIEVDGHVLIKDIDTGEVLLDKHNVNGNCWNVSEWNSHRLYSTY